MLKFVSLSVEDVRKTHKEPVLFVGRKDALMSRCRGLLEVSSDFLAVAEGMVSDLSGGDEGAVSRTMAWAKGGLRVLAFGCLPEACSRHNCKARPHGVTRIASECLTDEPWLIVAFLDDPSHLGAVACALGRALPLFNKKSNKSAATAIHTVTFFQVRFPASFVLFFWVGAVVPANVHLIDASFFCTKK